jgi:hypothetical protein
MQTYKLRTGSHIVRPPDSDPAKGLLVIWLAKWTPTAGSVRASFFFFFFSLSRCLVLWRCIPFSGITVLSAYETNNCHPQQDPGSSTLNRRFKYACDAQSSMQTHFPQGCRNKPLDVSTSRLQQTLASSHFSKGTDWRMHLNNYMEVNGGTKLIAYEYESSGERDNELTWSCRVLGACGSHAGCTRSLTVSLCQLGTYCVAQALGPERPLQQRWPRRGLSCSFLPLRTLWS